MEYEQKTVQFLIADTLWKTAPGEVIYRLVGRETIDTFQNKDLTHPSNRVSANTLNIDGTPTTIVGGATAGQVLSFDGANLVFGTSTGSAKSITVDDVVYPINGPIVGGGNLMYDGVNMVFGSAAVSTTRTVDVCTNSVLTGIGLYPNNRRRFTVNISHAIIDGITLTVGMRILVRDQTIIMRNYIYYVESIGASIILRQPADADSLQINDQIIVTSGNVNGNTTYITYVHQLYDEEGNKIPVPFTFARTSVTSRCILNGDNEYVKTGNLYIGEDTGLFSASNSSTVSNTYVGYQAGKTSALSTIYNNTFVGNHAGFGQIGYNNIMIGAGCGQNYDIGTHNDCILMGTAIASEFPYARVVQITPTANGSMKVSDCVFIGTNVNFDPQDNVSQNIIFIGQNVGTIHELQNVTAVGSALSLQGSNCVVYGLNISLGFGGSADTNNIVFGSSISVNALLDTVIGDNITINGGSQSTIIGRSISYANGINGSVVIGSGHSHATATLAGAVICIGTQNITADTCILIGNVSTSGGGVVVGNNATATSGTIIGNNATTTTGVSVGGGASSTVGVAIGTGAKSITTTGVSIGVSAGANISLGTANTVIGGSAGATLTSGTGCTLIGSTANVSSAGATDRIAIGRATSCAVNSTAVIGAGGVIWATMSSGGIATPGSAQAGIYTLNPLVTKTNAGAITLTVSEFGPGAVITSTAQAGPETWTTPTAANIIAKMPGAAIGMSYKWTLRNEGGNTITLAAGVGITLGSGLYTTLTNTVTKYKIVFTSLSAVTVQRVGSYSL